VDLFSGIGGFALAAKWTGFETVVFCEKDEFCQKVLQKRFGGFIADPESTGWSTWTSKRQFRGCNSVPIIPEIRDFDGTKWRGATLLTGGFPCQPFSVAGKRKGKEDDRFLWPEMLRVIKEAKPTWVIAENVTGIVKLALGQVLFDLESIGYDFPRDHRGTPIVSVIPACGLNAPHRRDRVWIIAYNGISQSMELSRSKQKCRNGIGDSNQDTPDSDRFNGNDARFGTGKIPFIEKAKIQGCDSSNSAGSGLPESQEDRLRESVFYAQRGNWQIPWIEAATRFCRVDDGVSNRIHRLKALGNAIVPQIAAEIMRGIRTIEEARE